MRTGQNHDTASRTAVLFWIAAAVLSGLVLFSAAAAGAATLCNVTSYGAKGDGQTKDTAAIQKAIDACEAKGGGTVRLAKGIYLTGPITLKSHITLDIEPGATLLGSQDKADYPDTTELRQPAVKPLIEASDAEDITIMGGGTIDGNGKPWWDDVYAHRHNPDFEPDKRPRLLILDHCRNVLIENVSIQNSASWQVVPYYSDHVTIRDGKILAPAHSPNTDGVDPFSSHHVLIDHMTIDVGDDNVAIKSGQPGSTGPDDPSTYITVKDCIFLHGHGMSIGSELSGGVQHVSVDRVSFENTGNGVRIKSSRDRGGDIGDLDFRNLTMHNVDTAILVTEYYPKIPVHDTPQPVTRLTPRFHDIHISNVVATGAKHAGTIIGLPESPITSIYLSNVDISAEKGMIVSDATVHAHGFTVKTVGGQPVQLLQNAQLVKR